MKNNLNILIADDHDLVREGLKLTLDKLPEPASFMEAGSADEVRQALADCPTIDLIILDLHMPGANGLDLLTTICNDQPDIPVVVLSAVEEPHVMQRAIDRGAAGFIPKSSANSLLVSAFQLVLAGGVFIPTEMLGRNAVDTVTRSESTHNMFAPPELTHRQIDVLGLLSKGASNKAIARKLGLSEHTVKIHITAIFRSLGVNNRTEAALAYRALSSQT
jgi:DNA-binding NarL/FixJ family response regulator